MFVLRNSKTKNDKHSQSHFHFINIATNTYKLHLCIRFMKSLPLLSHKYPACKI